MSPISLPFAHIVDGQLEFDESFEQFVRIELVFREHALLGLGIARKRLVGARILKIDLHSDIILRRWQAAGE
jgi:hypothetical protein